MSDCGGGSCVSNSANRLRSERCSAQNGVAGEHLTRVHDPMKPVAPDARCHLCSLLPSLRLRNRRVVELDCSFVGESEGDDESSITEVYCAEERFMRGFVCVFLSVRS